MLDILAIPSSSASVSGAPMPSSLRAHVEEEQVGGTACQTHCAKHHHTLPLEKWLPFPRPLESPLTYGTSKELEVDSSEHSCSSESSNPSTLL